MITTLSPRAQALPHRQATYQREQAFLERARSGEDVRNDVVLFLQAPLHVMARRIHWRYSQQQGNVIEVDDLVNSASAEILEHFEIALSKEEPFPYLYRMASITMLNCVNKRARLIKTHPDDDDIPVLSLDKPVTADGMLLSDLLPEKGPQAQKTLPLRQMLEDLPETQRLVIQRHFGLSGYPPESLNQVSRILSPHSPRPSNAYRYYRQALVTLRTKLTPTFPQYALTGGTR